MYALGVSKREDFRKKRREQALEEQRKRRRYLLTVGLTAIIIFFAGMGFGSLFARAEEPVDISARKYYTNVEIQPGDTLWTIADVYMDSHYVNRKEYLNELMELNHMSSDLLISGQKLIVPYYTAE